MSKVFLMIWLMLGTVLMGMAVTVVLVVPSLSNNEMSLILPAAVLGAVVALPFSWVITKQIVKN